MNPLEPFLTSRKPLWMDRLQALAEVILLAGLLSSILAAVPFSMRGPQSEILTKDARTIVSYVLLEACITLTLLTVLLKMNQQTFKDLGFCWDRWIANVGLGLTLIPLLFGTNIVVSQGFKILLPRYHMEKNPLVETIQSPQELILFLITVLIAGGLKEELQRAFILTRFRDHLGGAKLGLILWSILFGAGHYLQGLQGSVAAGIFGLLFGLVYLARGSLVGPIVAHGLYDMLALLGYWFLKGAA